MASNLSFWEKNTFFNDIDFGIIGSGIVGLTSSIELKKKFPNKKVVIFERSFLPSGASTKNAGFACFGSVSEILKDLTQFSENEVFSLIEKRYKGLLKIRNLVGDEKLGYEANGGYEVFNDDDSFEKCLDFIPNLNKNLSDIIGINTYTVADQNIKKFGFLNTNHLIFNRFEGLVDTGKMMNALISLARNLGVEIYNGIEISAIEWSQNSANLVLFDGSVLPIGKVLVTTNAFTKNLLPDVDLLPGRGQVLVTKPIANLKVKGAFHLDAGYFYFRNVGDRILLGGGRNLDFKAEQTTEFGTTTLVQNELFKLLNEIILPNQPFEIDYTWSGIMAFGNTQNPIIEQVETNIYCGVKCQGMGVALGALVGEELAQLVSNSI